MQFCAAVLVSFLSEAINRHGFHAGRNRYLICDVRSAVILGSSAGNEGCIIWDTRSWHFCRVWAVSETIVNFAVMMLSWVVVVMPSAWCLVLYSCRVFWAFPFTQAGEWKHEGFFKPGFTGFVNSSYLRRLWVDMDSYIHNKHCDTIVDSWISKQTDAVLGLWRCRNIVFLAAETWATMTSY